MEETIHLDLKDIRKVSYDVDVPLSLPAQQLCEVVANKYNLEKNDVRILYNGKMLNSEQTIGEIGMTSETKLRIFVTKGRGSNPSSIRRTPSNTVSHPEVKEEVVKEKPEPVKEKPEPIKEKPTIAQPKIPTKSQDIYSGFTQSNYWGQSYGRSSIDTELKETLLSMGYDRARVEKFCKMFEGDFSSVEEGVKSYAIAEEKNMFENESMFLQVKTMLNFYKKYSGKTYETKKNESDLNNYQEMFKSMYAPTEKEEEPKKVFIKSKEEPPRVSLYNASNKPNLRSILEKMTTTQQLECCQLYQLGYKMEDAIQAYYFCDFEYETALAVLTVE